MKTTTTILALGLFLGAPVAAAEPSAALPLDLETFDFGPGVTLVRDAETPILRIDNADGKNSPRLILEIEAPAIAESSYALLGEIRYEGVTGEGFLETWNHFPAVAGGRDIDASYFTRTMGESGPMGKIRGDADWRPFSLPFFMTDESGRRPLKITWNLYLEGPGLVELRNIRLLDGLPGNTATRVGWWWSPRTSGLLGGALGVILGTWGSLARFFAAKGTRLSFARYTFLAWIALGIPALLAGLGAILLGQPFHVFFIPLFIGGLTAAVGALEFYKLKNLATERELLRIRATDI